MRASRMQAKRQSRSRRRSSRHPRRARWRPRPRRRSEDVDSKISTMSVSWHIRKIRGLIYTAVSLTAVAIGASAYVQDPDLVQFWVAAREYYGMAALGFLLASVATGPLNYVAPWLPIRAHLVL